MGVQTVSRLLQREILTNELQRTEGVADQLEQEEEEKVPQVDVDASDDGYDGKERDDSRMKDLTYVELELQIFLEGLLCEYVKNCRGYSERTLEDLYSYTRYWVGGFIARHARPGAGTLLPSAGS